MSVIKAWRHKVQNYSKREKLFLFFIIALSIVSFALLVFVLVNPNERNICLTKECITAAHHVITMVDEVVDPCEDFYNFTCGTFLKTAIAKDQVSPLLVLHDVKNNGLKQIIVEYQNDEWNLTKSFRDQRKYYRACMNTTAIDEDKDQTFLEDLKYVIGGWPLAQGYVLDLFWPEVMLRARKKGMLYDWFFSIDTTVDYEEKKVFLELSPPPKVYYDKDVWKEQNVQRIVEIADYWGNHTVGAAWEVKKTIEFAKNLSIIVENAYRSVENQTDNKTITIKISKLGQLNFPRLQWLKFLQNFTGIDTLNENDDVIFKMNEDEYFRNLYYLLQKTDTKYWVDYISIIFLTEDCRYLSSKVKELCKDLMNPTMKQSQRSEFCVKRAISKFEGVAEAQYIRKTITQDKVKDIKHMIEAIKKEMEVTLKQTKWMDESTKENAIRHLKNITSAIGWTKTVFNEELFEKVFGYVKGELSSNNVVRMNHDLNRFYCDYHFKKISESFNDLREYDLSLPVFEVNAFYIKYWEILILVAPIIQQPVYDMKRPKYLNYGSLGSIIGHELTHAFSPVEGDFFTGQKYGFNITDYWTNRTHKNYDSATNCMIEEYDRYTKEIGIKLENNTKSLIENIADFTGINLAYRAYQTWAYFNGEEKKLPGLRFTSNQLFWILSSTYLCVEPKLESGAYAHPEIEPNLRHAVASFRVNGPIRNSPYFSNDFGCQTGRKMNPEKKCGVFV